MDAQSSSRRLSTDSDVSRLGSPVDSVNSSLSSTNALVLIHDSDDAIGESPFDNDNEDADDDDFDSTQTDRLRASSVPPLPSTPIFLYLLSPYLKLGALLLPSSDLPLKHVLPALFFFAVLSAFTRQIWYMLARYVKKSDMEEVVCDALARGGGKEGRRRVIRSLVRMGTGVVRVLVAVVYLRAAVEILLPLSPDTLFIPPRLVFTAILGIIVLPLSWAKSLAFRRIIYSTWLSIGAYVLWMGFETYAQAHGAQAGDAGLRMGTLWQSITTTAFAFSTISTLPLYASFKGTVQPITTASKYSLSFKILSALSVGVATGLMLPLVIASSSPNLQVSGFPSAYLMALLKVVILVSSIPSLIITCPVIPMPLGMRSVSDIPLSKIIVFGLIVVLSLVPAKISCIIQDVLLVLTLAGTYTVPALIHIITYQFKRPLSIVIPHTPALHRHHSSDSASSHDELLQRKERTLQRRRLWRRIVWDIGVWVVLLPLSGGGFVWASGRIVGVW